MKRILTGLLTVLLLIAVLLPTTLAKETAVTAAGAEDAASDLTAELEVVEPLYVMVWGKVTHVDIQNSRVELKLGGQDEGELILNIDGQTRIVDNIKHTAVKLKDIKVGETVYAFHSRAMTMSLPAQTYCYAMVVNVTQDKPAGQFIEVERVEKTADGYRFLNQQQDLFLTVPAGTKVKVFNTQRSVDISTVKPGTKLMAWYGMVALSYPAQAGTDELIVFPYDYEGYVLIEEGKITVDGERVSKQVIIKDGVQYVPMQDIARKLGFRVSDASGTLTLKKGERNLTFQKGVQAFTVNGDEVAIPAPYIVKSTLYVPFEAVDFLGDYKVAAPIR